MTRRSWVSESVTGTSIRRRLYRFRAFHQSVLSFCLPNAARQNAAEKKKQEKKEKQMKKKLAIAQKMGVR